MTNKHQRNSLSLLDGCRRAFTIPIASSSGTGIDITRADYTGWLHPVVQVTIQEYIHLFFKPALRYFDYRS